MVPALLLQPINSDGAKPRFRITSTRFLKNPAIPSPSREKRLHYEAMSSTVCSILPPTLRTINNDKLEQDRGAQRGFYP
jgi:hypothetical protein